MTDSSKARFEVVPGPSGGWSVRRSGDPEPISWHETREQAEAAARMQGEEGQEVDKRGDVFSSGTGAEAAAPKRTFALAAGFAVAVVLMIVIVALIAS